MRAACLYSARSRMFCTGLAQALISARIGKINCDEQTDPSPFALSPPGGGGENLRQPGQVGRAGQSETPAPAGTRSTVPFLRHMGTRWNASLPWKGGAYSIPCALVHAGEAGFEGVDAAGLAVQGGQQFPVIGVQLLEDSQVRGVDALPGGEHLSEELGPADRLGLGWLGADELLCNEQRRADDAGDGRPTLARQGACGGDLGVEVCAHGAWDVKRDA